MVNNSQVSLAGDVRSRSITGRSSCPDREAISIGETESAGG